AGATKDGADRVGGGGQRVEGEPADLGDGRRQHGRGDERAERGPEDAQDDDDRGEDVRWPTQRRPGAGLHGREIPPASRSVNARRLLRRTTVIRGFERAAASL